jgi:Flp pilus assembly protein TadD
VRAPSASLALLWLVASGASAETPEAIADKGIAFLEAGKFEQAERQFAQVLRANPKLVEAQNLMGVALDQQGKHAEAGAYFRRAIALRGDYAPAHANLGLNTIQ